VSVDHTGIGSGFRTRILFGAQMSFFDIAPPRSPKRDRYGDHHKTENCEESASAHSTVKAA
jgi:hypothetical protein